MQSNKSNTNTFGNLINLIYPTVLALIFYFVDYKYKFTYEVRGFENVLGSIITFASIVIGFYTAMYGVLITLNNSNIMKEFRKRKLESIFKFQLYDSLIVSFIILILSIIMQIAFRYPSKITNYFFDVWFTCIGYFMATSYRAISLLLKILFTKEKPSPSVEKKDSSIKQKQMETINKANEKMHKK